MLILLLLSAATADLAHPGPEAVEVDAEEESQRLAKEWDEHMKNFQPADLVTFELPGMGVTEFYEEIDTVPSHVRGAWFVGEEQSKDLDIQIFDTRGELIFERKQKHEGLFYFDAARRGIYRFVFSSRKIVRQQLVTFALHCGNSTAEVLQEEHLSPIENALAEASKAVKDFQMDQQFAQLRQESHYKTVADANSNLFWLSLLECVGIIGVTSWQVFYIKKLLDHRRLI
mmetsp:Transcript_13526/g.25464  ORF Transcript_13526/g.25464 Transcript_13526/m.25464 type:complete len:229 (+) Transcript_13526:1244-1930(+)|eukprot:CAMPEP_0204911634 /NCGR_PEP_ID=MMETSP1397-20131031/9935_1 /ASSEMBLY_ACC=CAM_ASM_000891 /TAXON_ID=49980 /ORGANISM="Climacostomum Climacostomum virens, Strain Stock W-24" /LENGTH=228 /DNA_ID=CAMNT_0052082253 /DNA_START=63 /DNA_END=749 /DNA_ORIENTATION=+